MVELVDTSDLKSEGDYLRPGSSPGVRTIKIAILLNYPNNPLHQLTYR